MLDWSRVEELRSEIGEDAFSEVVELFLDEVEGALLRLGTDTAGLEADLHFLKGCALNLGFEEFAALTADAERMARAGFSAGVDVAAVRNCYARSKRAFVAMLDGAENTATGTEG